MAMMARLGGVLRIYQFETILRGLRKPVIHHLRAQMRKMAVKFRRVAAQCAALAFV